jgi:hypothetical protein
MILERLLFHIKDVTGYQKPINPDIQIQNTFDDVLFDELDIVIALVKYEIEALVGILDEFLDYRLTFRQLAEAIALLPKVEPDNVVEFRAGKYKMLSNVAEDLRK